MTTEDKDVFLKSIKGVRPIKKSSKIQKKIKNTPSHLIKKKPITKELRTNTVEEKNININKIFIIEKGKINKELRRGSIPIDKKIDFHGKSLVEAENQFINTITNSFKEKQRCILFITGKGLRKTVENDNNTPKLFYGKIRNSFLDWIKKPELSKYILSVEKAGLKQGGDGAFYVYLRKNKN